MRLLIDILAVIGTITVSSVVLLVIAITVSSVMILVIALIFDTCDQDDFDD